MRPDEFLNLILDLLTSAKDKDILYQSLDVFLHLA